MIICLKNRFEGEKIGFIWLYGGEEEGLDKFDFVVLYLVDGDNDGFMVRVEERNGLYERG